jgi:L-threonylcarbamoyladenylate synthase
LAKILRGTAAGVRTAARALRAGQLVGVPTETVYGLAADALSARACRKIFQAKGRPSSDPLIVHVSGIEQAEVVAEVGAGARRIMEALWPGPLTLVLPKKKGVPAIVTAGRESVAVRMPEHAVMQAVIAAAGRPLAAPSANVFGYISPTCAEHVQSGLGKKIRFIVDGGPCEIGVESTIVDLRDEARPQLLRPGKIGRKEIERVLGRKVAATGKPAGKGQEKEMLAPGMMARHYSPRTPLVLKNKISARQISKAGADEAFVVFGGNSRGPTKKNVFRWTNGRKAPDLAQMARGLFALLRELDRGSWKCIHAELAPPDSRFGGLAEAINDRLRRAAAR